MCPSYQERTAYERSTAADASTAGRTLLRVLCLSTLNNVRLHPCRYRQSPRRNTTVQVATFVLNDCLAYLRFGAIGPGRVKTKSNLVVALSGGGIFAFFALSVTTSLKIPGAVIPRRVFTRPGSLSDMAASPRHFRSSPSKRTCANAIGTSV